MIYADTDFFLAILKESDWLQSDAQKMYANYKGQLYTSYVTLIELALICKKKQLDPAILIPAVFDLVLVEGISLEQSMYAVYCMQGEKMGVFDSFHAALSGEEIISSDKAFDKIGKKRFVLHL